ncbi:MAG: porin [Syntrophothermus sp.]
MKFTKTLIIVFVTALSSFLQAQDKAVDLTPKFSGDARTWYENDMANGRGNFLVRNARLQVTGNASEIVSYKFIFDFAALPKSTLSGSAVTTDLSLLGDAFISIKPVNSLALSLGQFKVPFSTENIMSTNQLPFSNRPLMSQTVTPAVYDLGFLASYSNTSVVPVDFDAAVYNGNGQNKSENDRTDNYAIRAVVKPIPDFNVAVNYAGGRAAGFDVKMFDFSAGYKMSGFTFAAEYASRKTAAVKQDINSNSMLGYVVYDLPVTASVLKYVSPALRYEVYDPTDLSDKDHFTRLTAGLTFSFAKLTWSHFRINYELLGYKNVLNEDKNDGKMILEYQIRF